MKNLLPHIKGNLLSLIAIVLAILAAPAMWYFSAGWRESVHQQIEDKVRQDLSQVNSVDVTYQVPGYMQGVEEVSIKAPPNSATTQRVASLLANLSTQISGIRDRAIDFNSAEKPLLVGTSGGEQLFPEPTSESVRLRLLDEIVDVWPAAHRQLLRDYKAGEPPASISIRTRLETDRDREIARRGGNEDALTPDQLDEVDEALGLKRLEYYNQHANSLSFYATRDVFEAVQPWNDVNVLPIESAWEWQHLYWIHKDIIRGVFEANRGRGSTFTPVHRAPIKRILSIRVARPESGSSSSGGRSGRTRGGDSPGEAQPVSVDDKAPLQPDYTLSHTGRASWPIAPNSMFDIRFVDLEILADSARLPQIFEAFEQVNFMTVVGMDLEEYDLAGDLARGYDYGGDHIVKATLRIETLWLRSWLGQYMPATVRQASGIPDPEPAPDSDSAEGDDPS